MMFMAIPTIRKPSRWAMSLVATLMMTVPAMGQEASAPATGDDPKPMTEVKPVTNSDTQTIEPGAKSDSGEMTPAADEGASRTPDRRRRSAERTSPDMQSAPKVSADDVLKQFERDRPKARPLLPGSRPGTDVVRDTIVDDDPRRPEVAGDVGARMQGDRRRGRDVASDLAVDVGALGLDVRLDVAAVGDHEVPGDLNSPLDPPLDDQVLFADEGAADGHAGADEARR